MYAKRNNLSMSVQTFRTITRAEIMMKVKMSVLNQNNFRNVIKHPINLCEFFREPRIDPVLNMLYQQADKVKIKQLRCPIPPVSS